MTHILRNRRKKAPKPSFSTWLTPQAELPKKLENDTANDYTDYTDILTLFNQKHTYRSQIRTSILNFGLAATYFFLTAILLAKNVFCLILFLLLEASPHRQYCCSGHVGNLGNLGLLEGMETH